MGREREKEGGTERGGERKSGERIERERELEVGVEIEGTERGLTQRGLTERVMYGIVTPFGHQAMADSRRLFQRYLAWRCTTAGGLYAAVEHKRRRFERSMHILGQSLQPLHTETACMASTVSQLSLIHI